MAVMGRTQGAYAARKARADLRAGAAQAGWAVDASTHTVAETPFPEHLGAHLVKPAQRVRLVTGEDFTFSSWKCKRISGGRVRMVPVTLHLLQHAAPEVDLELFFGRMPDGRNPIVMPEVFRDRVALLPEAKVMAGGDIEKVLAELEPLLAPIVGPGLALVAWHGEIALLGLDEPTVAELASWADLARQIRAALGTSPE